jgi:ketosteroid isomerase-like protein
MKAVLTISWEKTAMTTAEPASIAVRDGKITSVREYTDTQHVEHVLFGQR